MGGALFSNQQELMQKLTAKHKAERGEPAKEAEEELQKLERLRAPEEHWPQDQISKAHEDSQRRTQKPQTIYRSQLGPMYIPYGCVV